MTRKTAVNTGEPEPKALVQLISTQGATPPRVRSGDKECCKVRGISWLKNFGVQQNSKQAQLESHS